MGTYQRVKEGIQTKTSTGMFKALLLTLANRWKQSKCLSIGEWIKYMCYSHTTNYPSAIKCNELLLNAKVWMNVENILSKKRPLQKSQGHLLILRIISL